VGIIALTLLEGDVYRQAALAAGADDVIRKAELTTDLLPAIRRAMQANRFQQGLTKTSLPALTPAFAAECANRFFYGPSSKDNIAPTDESLPVVGRWEDLGAGQVEALFPSESRGSLRFTIVSCDGNRLRIRL
jgi:hypothetical protein